MNLKITVDSPRLTTMNVEKDKMYEIKDYILNKMDKKTDYIIAVPMKQKNKYKRVLVSEDDGELID